MIDLIYCAGSNKRLMTIAQSAGFLLGIRSDKCAYDFPMAFIDIEYRKSDFIKHLEIVQQYRPKYAIVPDLSAINVSQHDNERALMHYWQLAPYCEIPLIVPKLPGQLAYFPDFVAVAYSIPSTYGGARYGLHELSGRMVHLLGGNPEQQHRIARWIRQYNATVISVDGNMAQKLAQKAVYWNGTWKHHEKKGSHETDLMYECWQRSCQHIVASWRS